MKWKSVISKYEVFCCFKNITIIECWNWCRWMGRRYGGYELMVLFTWHFSLSPLPLPNWWECRNPFMKWGGTHRADSVTPNNRMIVKVMMDTGDLQLNVGSKPWWGPGIPHIHKLYVVREGFGMRKNSHWIWPGLNPQPQTTRSP